MGFMHNVNHIISICCLHVVFQDTVVALQALAKYAERPEFNNIDLECSMTSEKTNEYLLTYRIVNTNAKVQKEVDVGIF